MENQKTPFIEKVEPGTYYYCTCGKSKTLPRCDGSHQGSEFTPCVTTITEATTLAICGCGKSNGLYCNGAHKSINE